VGIPVSDDTISIAWIAGRYYPSVGSPDRFSGSYPQGTVAGKLDCPIRMNVERPFDGMTRELALVVETWLFPHAFTGFMIWRA
jgi:hypothetical protein